jgi:hypothetical protein
VQIVRYHRFTGVQGIPGWRGEVSPDGRNADYMSFPTHPGTHQETTLLRKILENFAKQGLQAECDQP